MKEVSESYSLLKGIEEPLFTTSVNDFYDEGPFFSDEDMVRLSRITIKTSLSSSLRAFQRCFAQLRSVEFSFRRLSDLCLVCPTGNGLDWPVLRARRLSYPHTNNVLYCDTEVNALDEEPAQLLYFVSTSAP